MEAVEVTSVRVLVLLVAIKVDTRSLLDSMEFSVKGSSIVIPRKQLLSKRRMPSLNIAARVKRRVHIVRSGRRVE